VIARKIEALKESPEKQGKALSGDLSGYRILHAADPLPLTSIYEKTKTGSRLSLAHLINRGGNPA
jgi:hypothetical protein